MAHKLVSPLSLVQTKKKNFILNLNIYRNAHFRTLHGMKIKYKEYMKSQIELLPKMGIITIEYILYPKTHRRTDLGNVLSIHQKFVEDALTELGRIEDDDYKHITHTSFSFGSLDKENPRVEIFITET